jgi:hypothetical protein
MSMPPSRAAFGSSSHGFGSNAGMGGGSWQQQQLFGSVPQQQSTGSSSLFGGFPQQQSTGSSDFLHQILPSQEPIQKSSWKFAELAENKNKILFLVLTRNMTINK